MIPLMQRLVAYARIDDLIARWDEEKAESERWDHEEQIYHDGWAAGFEEGKLEESSS